MKSDKSALAAHPSLEPLRGSLARKSQEEPGGARRSQEGPGGARRNQGARRGQEEPAGARRNQEEQGGARRSQEEPGTLNIPDQRMRGLIGSPDVFTSTWPCVAIKSNPVLDCH